MSGLPNVKGRNARRYSGSAQTKGSLHTPRSDESQLPSRIYDRWCGARLCLDTGSGLVIE
jgi:hypothetical protein